MKFAAYFGLAVLAIYVAYGAYQDSKSGNVTFADAAKTRVSGLFQTA